MAGRVNDPSGNCCIMGEGDFAVVPSMLIDESNAHFFLPSCSVSACSPRLSVHSLNDSLTLVADSSLWDDRCTCHEVEPMLVECLKSGADSVHAALFADRLYISVLKNDSLAFVNRHTSSCDEDTLYHILAAYKATNLDRMRHPLFVRGELKKTFLNKYIARCE